jgi:excisionase family DNA binding protein
MSSNIEVQRICQHCGNEFTARRTTTLYCSHKCNSAAYKAGLRAAKVKVSNKETLTIKTGSIEQLKAKEFLSVRDVSKLIGCSRQTVYTLINSGGLKAINIKVKKTLVRRSDIDNLFEQPQPPVMPQPEDQASPVQYQICDCYTLTEVQTKYKISETALQAVIKRNKIPKLKKGWFAYVPKTIIDNLFAQPTIK